MMGVPRIRSCSVVSFLVVTIYFSLCFPWAVSFSSRSTSITSYLKNGAGIKCSSDSSIFDGGRRRSIGRNGNPGTSNLYATTNVEAEDKTKKEQQINHSPTTNGKNVDEDNNKLGPNPSAAEQEDNNNSLLLEAKTLTEQERQKMKNIILFLCWGVACLSALDRVAMSVAIVPLSAEFGYTDTMKGAISSLFSVGYGLAIIPAGIVVATASPRIVMACGITVWSLATIATPHAAAYSSMLPLLMARASVGAAESVVLPSLQTLMSSWVQPEHKSRSLATVFSGFHAGTVGAYLVSPLIIEYLGGWRDIFLLYGGIGLFWLVPWMFLAQDSPQAAAAAKLNIGTVIDVPTSSSAPNNNNLGNKALTGSSNNSNSIGMSEWAKSVETLKAAPWGDFATSKGAWAMLIAHAGNNWGLYNNLAWSPTFYSEQYGLNVRDSALFSVLPSVAGAAGGFVAGFVSDQLLSRIEEEDDQEKRDAATTKVRKAMQGIALFGPAMALLTLSSRIPEEPWVAQSLLMGTTGLMAFNSAGYLSANQEKAGEKWAGLLYSITSLPAVMTGTFGVYLTGQILDLTHQDWSVVFALNAGINLLSATAFVILYDSKREFD